MALFCSNFKQNKISSSPSSSSSSSEKLQTVIVAIVCQSELVFLKVKNAFLFQIQM